MLRQLTDSIHGRNLGIAAMVNKLVGTELNHDLSTAAMELMGDYLMLARGECQLVQFFPFCADATVVAVVEESGALKFST